jgi:Cu(I)/Ag(I) efflux system membrane protein CusA/SilA
VIGNIIELSARNRALVLFGALAMALAGLTAVRNVRVDAIPDLTDPQVIVFTEWMGRSPTLVEDQVTYPLVTALLSAPHVADVRGQSMFGMSFVYVIFDEGTDLYWARSRVLELLDTIRARLPADAAPRLGPDATGTGWVYQYALVDRSGRHDLGALRTFQDFTLRYALASVPGVAEVATVGGFEPQYQVTVDPTRLRNFGVTLSEVADAIRRSNRDVGGRLLEMSQREYFVRGRGYLTSVDDILSVVIRANASGTPLRVGDVGTVRMGPEIRRGAADFDGLGDVVSGIVVMREGENAMDVITRVERKLADIRGTFPAGVEAVPVYNRAGLIQRAIATLKHALTDEMLIVAGVILLFLLHVRSALLPIVSLPLAVLLAFVPMWLFGIPATIMSLGGIAIAIGATVDAEIVMVEAAHKKLEHAPPNLTPNERRKLLAQSAREVTPAIFFSLLVVAASFIPVFGLTGQAGRLFRPMAFTKTFVMLAAALLSITVAPAMRDTLLRGRIRPESKHPVSRAIRALYEPFVYVALRNPWTTVLIGAMALVSAIPVAQRLGSEFMPPLDEGDMLVMPTTLPNVSIEEAQRVLQRQDAILRSFPEVVSVLGKVGRADSPTDPAPLSMIETVVQLRPHEQWRTHYVRRWYVGRTPSWMRPWLQRIWPEFEPIDRDDLVREMNARLQFPGWTNAFTQPIRTRIDMNSTGIRTPVGIKIYGRDLGDIERAGIAIERVMGGVSGARSVLFERQSGGLYLDIAPRRDDLARYGLRVDDVNDVIESALGGLPITTTIEGRNRFSVNVRYPQAARSSVESIRSAQVPLPTGQGGSISLGDVADVRVVPGPPMIKDESGMLVGYVFVDVEPSRDIGSFVDDARAVVDGAVRRGDVVMASGMYLRWTGQYELLTQMKSRMKLLVPLALLIVIVLLYLQFENFTEVAIVLLSVPFALVGSAWAVHLLGYNLSTAVWVGVIALIGLATQTGVVMIVYIDQAYERRLRAGKIRTLDDIVHAHAEGTVQRVRPKLMTVGTMLFGLVPLLWARGSGADVMRRIAAPMVGGLVTSAFLTLEIIPVIYTYWRNEQLVWSKLERWAPHRLTPLRILRTTIVVSVLTAIATTVVRFYVSGAPHALAGVALPSGLVAIVCVLGYVAMRPWALHGLADRPHVLLPGEPKP